MELIDETLEKDIEKGVMLPIRQQDFSNALEGIGCLVDELYSRIPADKRASYGIVYVIDTLSGHLYSRLSGEPPILEASSKLLELSVDFRTGGVALGVLADQGTKEPSSVIRYFEDAASSDEWNMREMAQFFFRRVIKGHPEEARGHLLRWSASHDPKLRRFVAETLRPVKENRWFYKEPDYPLSILRGLFSEHDRYPRASVGNNLSDLSRKLPDLVLSIVGELAKTGNADSYWIAYRACRNLVKERPEEVMRLLGVNEYKYKERAYVLR